MRAEPRANETPAGVDKGGTGVSRESEGLGQLPPCFGVSFLSSIERCFWMPNDAGKTLQSNTDAPLVVALDIGTSSVRAIVFDTDGTPSADHQIPYSQTTTSDGGVEVDAEELLRHCIDSLTQLLRDDSVSVSQLKAVGISCFWHSLLGVGGDGLAVTPVYSWADTRAAGQVAKLRELFDSDQYHATTGCELHPCFWPAKLLWLRESHAGLYQKARRWMGFGEYLQFRLFGKDNSSLSMASGTGLFNQQKCDWDDSIVDTLKLDRQSICAVKDFEPVSGLKSDFAGKLAALAQVPWFPSVGDGACSNIGSGGTDDTRIVLNIGTSAAMRIVADVAKGADYSIKPGLFSYRVNSESIVVGGAFANGGNVYAWLKDRFTWEADVTFDKELEQIRPDSHGLTVLPFWSGERSPGWHSGAKASILGMNLHTNSADIVRASLEACAYSFDTTRKQLHKDFSNARQLVVSGGAISGNPLFAQIVCDVFGTELTVNHVAEASARGAALLALYGVGALKNLSNAPFQPGAIYSPNKQHNAQYAAAAERYHYYYDKLINS
jgi:gluconokinase